ncbi:MAG: protein kinase [Pirellulaceae bacterium]
MSRLAREIAESALLKCWNCTSIRRFTFSQALIEGVSTIDQWVRGSIAPSQLPSLDRFYEACIPLCGTLAHLHDQNVIHRDIKPNNTLIDGNGNVHLIDFGSATRIRSLGHWCDPSLYLGTFRYLAPEIILGDVQTTASDIFGLGRMMFLLLAGRLPCFHQRPNCDLTQSDVATQIGEQLPYQTPHRLVDLCVRMHSFDPRVRPSASEVLESLTQSLPNVSGPRCSRPTEDWSASTIATKQPRSGCQIFAVDNPESHRLANALEAIKGNENLLILKSRTHSDEKVPYRAISPLISELVQWLHNIDPIVRRKWKIHPRSAALNHWPLLQVLSPADARVVRTDSLHGARELGSDDLAELFRSIATNRTVVLCFEDLQHADAESCQIIAALQQVAADCAPADPTRDCRSDNVRRDHRLSEYLPAEELMFHPFFANRPFKLTVFDRTSAERPGRKTFEKH